MKLKFAIGICIVIWVGLLAFIFEQDANERKAFLAECTQDYKPYICNMVYYKQDVRILLEMKGLK